MATVRFAGFKAQLGVSLFILVGLFFVEYPPIFLLGYWSWGAVAHKTLTGALIALNLVLTQYAVKRLGYFRSQAGARPAPGDAASPA